MLMFVFGAGASYDSDPDRWESNPQHDMGEFDFRPPLAPGLFDPSNWMGKEVVAEFPRAASLLMRLRLATREGQDVEEVLEQVALTVDSYPETATQLLALRAYLAQLLDRVPQKWAEECQGLTNYVLALEQADRWNRVTHPAGGEPVMCVTFNYDSLLELAVHSVFGHPINHIDMYVQHPQIHVYKPHGSVSWRQSATWDHPPRNWINSGKRELEKAINEAATLRWHEEFVYQNDASYQDSDDTTKVWLPAISIPVRSKSDFTMPDTHMAAMLGDLRNVTTLIAVGWRGREQHFLKLLQDNLGSSLVRLVVVAESDDRAREAVDNLWVTGRFDRYAISGVGFSGFAEIEGRSGVPRSNSQNRSELSLNDLLTNRGAAWTKRDPASGPIDAPTVESSLDAGYVEI
jgi:SIR2-like domain